jgi:hypothetical protein
MTISPQLLFPPSLIPALKDARGAAWRTLVEETARAEEDSPQKAAFVLLMARLANCAACKADTYRALHGCEKCSLRALRHYRDSDEALIEEYRQALREVEAYIRR